MKLISKIYKSSVLLSVIFSVSLNSFSQTTEKTVVRGKIVDALTGEPIPFASVSFKGTTVGTLTDNSGKYLIETKVQATTISFSFIGYQTETRKIKPGADQTFNISMKISSITLDEVTVKPEKKNYRNKNNPAVEIIENVIARKNLNRQGGYSFLQYDKYEKIQFAFSNISEKFQQRNSTGKFGFVFNNVDTTRRVGNNILPVFIKESLSSHYYRKEPLEMKDIIHAEKTVDLDKYFNNKGVSAYLNYLYQNIDIYNNEILFLTNKFLSPIASTAPAFYRYYIIDTLTVNDIKCIRLFFEARNKADFLFHGNLYITMDSCYAVRKIDMGINKDINIDWVQDIVVTQDFDRFGQKSWLLSKEEISIDLGIVQNTMGLYGQRTIYYRDYKLNEPIEDEIFKGPQRIERTDAAADSTSYWEANRFVPLNKAEKEIYHTIDTLQQMPAFRRRMDLIMMATVGFLNLGKVEIGPVGSFYSYNNIEGSRFRFGGRTTPELNKKIIVDGYLAYGIKDRIFKYNAGISYSFTPRTVYQFPVKALFMSYQKDTKLPGVEFQLLPGVEFQFTQQDNILFSVKRGVNDKLLLNNTFRIEYLNEFENHFSYRLGYSFTRQYTAGNLYFNKDVYGSDTSEIRSVDIPELSVDLRFARNESFFQGKIYRTLYPGKYPVIQLKIAYGSKIINNNFEYLRLQLNISKRYYIGIAGYTDVTFEAGKIFGKVAYPILFIHNANQTYSYQKNSYNLMNFLEFVSDQYVALNINHSFNGFIFNKIPLLKKLKLRELVTFKILYGSLSDRNNPDPDHIDPDLFQFPKDAGGNLLTYTLDRKPYIEAGVGLSNILNLIRIDVIKRFTYVGNPNVSSIGIRIKLMIDI
ncbi:MAG: DUF5686 family protein [Bacteroidia bacterium]|nr:DUF5686 family protein [Bacteroidia bacterium]